LLFEQQASAKLVGYFVGKLAGRVAYHSLELFREMSLVIVTLIQFVSYLFERLPMRPMPIESLKAEDFSHRFWRKPNLLPEKSA